MKKTTIEGLASPAVAAASTHKSQSSPVFKVDIRRSLHMHRTAALSVGAAVFLLVVLFGLTRQPLYMAKTLTYVEPLTKSVLSDGTGVMFDPSRYDSYLQQQMLTATRPDILQAALARLPAGTWQQPEETTQSAVARLQTALKMERVTTSYQLSISLTGTNPVATAATVNAVTDAWLAQGKHDEHLVSDQRLKLLSEERQRIQAELDQDRAEQTSLGQVLGVANPVGESANPYDLQLANVRSELQSARQAHDVAAAQLSSLRNESGARSAGMVASADELIAGDSGLSSMKSTINQRKATLSTQMAGLTPANPVYKQDQDEIADLDKSLDTMTTDLRDKAERQLEDKLGLELRRTGDIEGRLNGQLAQQTATATNAGPRLQRAAELSADLVRLTARYATVDDAMRGMQLEANGPGLAHLSVAAAVPTAPEASKQKLLLLAALPLALFAGVLAAVVLHKRDPRVYTAADVEGVLGFVPIGVLPARVEVSEPVVEEYLLRLAAGLESAYRVSAARSYVFTAASPQTDVSEFVLALRRKLGQLGLTALIVEASRLLEPVLLEGRTGELLRSAETHEGFAMANLDRLKSEHDLLLIDAPPLLLSAETEYAVRCTDATILIAECGVTLRAELTQSASLMERLNVVGVGTVLDQMKLRFADARYRQAVGLLERRPSTREPSRVETGEAAKGVAPATELAAEEPVIPPAAPMETIAKPVPIEIVEAPLQVMPAPEPVMAVAPEAVALVREPEPVAAVLPLAAEPRPMLRATPAAAEFEPEPVQKTSWIQRLFARGSEATVSILPEGEDEDDEPEVRIAAEHASLRDREPAVQQPGYDIVPAETFPLAPVAPEGIQGFDEPVLVAAAPVSLHEPVILPKPAASSEPVLSKEPIALEPVVVSEPVLVDEPVPSVEPALIAEPAVVKGVVRDEVPEPAFVQVFEEPAFTRDEPLMEEPAPLVAEPVASNLPFEREVPVTETPAARVPAAVETVRVEPLVVEPAGQREYPVRRPDVRPAYVPPMAAAMRAVGREPLTTGRWEPVRPVRVETVQNGSGLQDGGRVQPTMMVAERGVSRISGARRAAAQEFRGIEQKPTASTAAAQWVPPATAPGSANPAEDDSLQARPRSLTRRWELLSRFDQGNGTSAARPVQEEVAPALTGRSHTAGYRGVR